MYFGLKKYFSVSQWALTNSHRVKAFVPRYRYDQLMRLGWKVFLPVSLAMIVIVAGVLEIVRG